eukprot:gi/632985833/ref/XP_007909903.1/ PREDICTED: intestinal mucin-like protein [Callorhinchus milii]
MTSVITETPIPSSTSSGSNVTSTVTSSKTPTTTSTTTTVTPPTTPSASATSVPTASPTTTSTSMVSKTFHPVKTEATYTTASQSSMFTMESSTEITSIPSQPITSVTPPIPSTTTSTSGSIPTPATSSPPIYTEVTTICTTEMSETTEITETTELTSSTPIESLHTTLPPELPIFSTTPSPSISVTPGSVTTGNVSSSTSAEWTTIATVTVAVSPSTLTPTTSITGTTIMFPSSSSALTSSSVLFSTSTSPSTTYLPSTTECFCILNGTVYPQGAILYNYTDETGYCIWAFCNETCIVEKHIEPCISITTQPTTSSKTEESTEPMTTAKQTTVESTTSTTQDCPDFDPPRLHNETWHICDCLMATCIVNNVVAITPIVCPPVENIICANGYSPAQVYDDYHCCLHSECGCQCSGWGGSHYVTFDGQQYNYEGNCTYVLVEEINTTHNFGVYIDNYECNSQDGSSCLRAMIVKFDKVEIQIKNNGTNGGQFLVTVKGTNVSLPYSNYGVSIFSLTTHVTVEIPKIEAQIIFYGMGFSVKLPYKFFGNNTQGQCGTCTNDQSDDCMLPNGKQASSCSEMAAHWQVKDANKPNCNAPPSSSATPRPHVTPSDQITQHPCDSNSVCNLFKTKLFELCDQGFSSNFYYDACIIDGCVNQDIKKACTSLQMYAAECMSRKQLCIDWRNYTGGQCSLKCPSNKIYKTCESSKEQTCTPSNENVLQPEGCFCPGNTINFSPGSDICVDKWEGCMGPDGVHRKFGESFEFKCQDCICDNITQQVICQPHKCDSSPSVTCDGDGFIVAKVPNPKDHCCMETECKCIISLCNSTEIKCDLGFNIVTKTPDGKCCPVSTCEPMGVCVNEGAEYRPGADIPLSKCQRCTCTNETNPETQLNKISCQNVECNKKCEQGFEYQEMTDECCGKCVQVKCLVDLGDQPVVLLPPGDELPSPYNNCTVFGCTQIHDFLLLNVSKIICPDFDEDNCEPGTISITENGCCKTCEYRIFIIFMFSI